MKFSAQKWNLDKEKKKKNYIQTSELLFIGLRDAAKHKK
jgi:hypothetical protein